MTTRPHADDAPNGSSRRNVVLTGFMGTGKSTIGRLLAPRLGYVFVDTDELIERRHGPISAIFSERGEDAFRALEREVADELSRCTGHVVATGGRLMLDDTNASYLGATADVFCLAADVESILGRVTAPDVAADRPLLEGPDVRERIERLLAERADGYGRFEQVETDLRDPRDVVDDIVDRLTSRSPGGRLAT